MTNPESPEETAGGVLGHVVGKAKSVAGALVGNEDLEREGNLQQAQATAEAGAASERAAAQLRKHEAAVAEERVEAEVERERLRAELAADEHKERIEREERERERQATSASAQQQVQIDQERDARERVAGMTEAEALGRRAADAKTVARLNQEAIAAERSAAAIDPEEK